MFIERKIGSEQIRYNPSTGEVQKFCKRPGRHQKTYGYYKVTGISGAGYPHVSIDGKKVSCHRLAFGIMGYEIPPESVIDHVNGDKLDTRWANLRILTHAENMNAYRSESRSGISPLVIKSGRRYKTTVYLSGREFTLYLDTPAEASAFLFALMGQNK